MEQSPFCMKYLMGMLLEPIIVAVDTNRHYFQSYMHFAGALSLKIPS